jgi:hypothetical protein
MSGNRVEELEAKVRELEATVDGLTDELVETKERLETIEDETGIEPDVFESGRTRAKSDGNAASRNADADERSVAETDENTDAEDAAGTGDEETTDSADDDIIVA